MTIRCVLVVAVALAAGCARDARLLLGTTHTIEDSGLLETITGAFESAHPEHDLSVIVAGSGEILTMARNRDLDVLLTHSPDDEIAFIAAGHGESRQPVMYNDYVLLGPRDDPARAAAAPDVAAAMSAVQQARALFVSRGDDSGTHRKERQLWADAHTVPDWSGYIEAGTGMADALRLADQRDGYILADRATYEKLRSQLTQLRVVHEGDARLRNQYSVIVIDSAHNLEGARVFAEWIRSQDAQRQIREHGLDTNGKTLFTPDAR